VPQLVAPVSSVVDATATSQQVGNHELRDVRSPLATLQVRSESRRGQASIPARTGYPTGGLPVSGCCPRGLLEIAWAASLGSWTFPAHRGPGARCVMTVPVVTGPPRRDVRGPGPVQRRNWVVPGGMG